MKRKQPNPEVPTKDLIYLQKKLNEQKQNLLRQNKKLQKQIHQQIQQNRQMKTTWNKKQQSYQATINQLQQKIQHLETELLMQDEENNSQQHQKQLKDTRDAYKSLNQQNSQLQAKVQEYAELINNMYEDINDTKAVNQSLKRKLQNNEQETKALGAEINTNKQYYEQLQRESDKTIHELEQQIEINIKNEGLLNQIKKKNKQFTQNIRDLQHKYQAIIQKEKQDYQFEINQLKKCREQFENSCMEKNRQIQFLKISDSQKTGYIQTVNRELSDLRKLCDTATADKDKTQSAYDRTENQNRRLQIQIQKQKSKIGRQIEEINKAHQEDLIKIKRKTAEQVLALFRTGNDIKVIDNYIEGLKSYKSQMNLRGNAPPPQLIKVNDERGHTPFQKLKYETQIAGLKSEVESLKKHIEQAYAETGKTKKMLDEVKMESQNRQSKVKELNLVIEKVQNDRRIEDDRHYRQISKYRNVETEVLEARRTNSEMEEAYSIKTAYYDRKIKDYIDSVDRKESMIESLKAQKVQFENKSKFMEDKLARALEDIQNLKRFKNDTVRKEELVKEYKDKIEKLKTEADSHKSETQKLRKQKTRLERNLQSKEEYINSLKTRIQKDETERDSKNKQVESAAIQSIKQKYLTKLKKTNKKVEQLQNVVQAMRCVVGQKIQQAIMKAGSGQGNDTKNWEAAQLLGLKSGQIEEFVNPGANLDRNICEDLDSLWQNGKYEDFMRNSIDYILLKNERDLQIEE